MSQQMSLEMNHLLEHHGQVASFGNLLSHFIRTAHFDISLKDAQKETYIQTSTSVAKNIGVESCDDLVGLTANDIFKEFYICERETIHVWKSKEIERIKEQDYQAKMSQFIVGRRHIFFTTQGFILILNALKIPVLAHNTCFSSQQYKIYCYR